MVFAVIHRRLAICIVHLPPPAHEANPLALGAMAFVPIWRYSMSILRLDSPKYLGDLLRKKDNHDAGIEADLAEFAD